jgi:hypothetical protein
MTVELLVDLEDGAIEWFNEQYGIYNWKWNDLRGTSQWSLN